MEMALRPHLVGCLSVPRQLSSPRMFLNDVPLAAVMGAQCISLLLNINSKVLRLQLEHIALILLAYRFLVFQLVVPPEQVGLSFNARQLELFDQPFLHGCLLLHVL